MEKEYVILNSRSRHSYMFVSNTSLIAAVLLSTIPNNHSHLPPECCQELNDFSLTSFKAQLDSIEDFIISEMESFHVQGLAACIVYDDQVVCSFTHGYQVLDSTTVVEVTTLQCPDINNEMRQ